MVTSQVPNKLANILRLWHRLTHSWFSSVTNAHNLYILPPISLLPSLLKQNRQKCDFIRTEMLTAIPHKSREEICEIRGRPVWGRTEIKGPTISRFPSFRWKPFPEFHHFRPMCLSHANHRLFFVTLIITIDFLKHAWAERGPSRCRWLLPVLTRWSGLVVLTAFGRYVPRWMSNVQCPMVILQIEKWSTN